MNNLHVSAIQTFIKWEDKTHNLNHFEFLIKNLPDQTDLIVLPEMFTSGFSMNSTLLAEPLEGETLAWMKKMSKMADSAIMGSFIVQEAENIFNRLVFVDKRQQHQFYDKAHLFFLEKESNRFVKGRKNIICSIGSWNVMPQICYDLRFPVWSRNVGNKYDVLVYVANWPQERRDAWITLLKARAIENQCYVIGVNRVGNDGNEISYQGDTMIIDFKGNSICSAKESLEDIISTTLSRDILHAFRQKFPVSNDADDFHLVF